MDHSEQIDHAEHAYWDAHCPACDSSPCIGPRCDGYVADVEVPVPFDLDSEVPDQLRHDGACQAPGCTNPVGWYLDDSDDPAGVRWADTWRDAHGRYVCEDHANWTMPVAFPADQIQAGAVLHPVCNGGRGTLTVLRVMDISCGTCDWDVKPVDGPSFTMLWPSNQPVFICA